MSDPHLSTKDLEGRAGVLVEALPYMQEYRDAVFVVKYGGAAMGDAALADAWARDVVLLEHVGIQPLVVHGGGPALTRMMERLGIESKFVDGHRMTTAESAELAEMVLSGRINKEIVARLNGAGAKAIGLSGTDARMLRVRRHQPGGRDIGFVGEVEAVDTAPLSLLLAQGFVPVLSSTAAGEGGQPYNINADLVAGAVAAAMKAEKLVFLSDVPGVLVDGKLAEELTATRARELLRSGQASGGMMPKLQAALAALEAGVPRVHLLDGRLPHALLLEIFTDRGVGTLVVPDGGPRPSARRPAQAAPPPPPRPRAERPAAEAPPAWAGTLAERGGRAVMATYARYPLELVSGRGARVTDSSGRQRLDFVAGIATNVLGHAHPAVEQAIREHADGLLHVSNLYWTEPMVRLAERLTAATGMDRAFFCNSGAEAVEAMLKLARKARPGRPRIVCFDRSFHGRTMGALSATAQPHYQEAFRPLVPGFLPVPYGDLAACEAAIDATTAAVIVEVVQGEGGVRPAPAGFLAGLRAACDRAGALLLFDEVQTGLGRTGTLYAFQGAGVVPDALASAKALAGGLPMGAMLARGEAASVLQPGDHASTFGGGPFVASVAHAVLDVVTAPGFLEGVQARSARLAEGLRSLCGAHEHAIAERGAGLLRGLQLDGLHAPALVGLLHERGLLTAPAGKDVLRLAPPLMVSDADVDEAIAAIDDALGALGRSLNGSVS